MDDLNALMRDFRWIPFRMDPGSGRVTFARVERDLHREVAFMDDEVLRRGVPLKEVGLAAMAPLAGEIPQGECHFIFHSAFCCSTLLARAMDVEGHAMGLKEPLVLANLAAAARAARSAASVRRPLELMLALLSRPFGAGEKVVVKPTNVANDLIEQMLGLRPEARALLVYSPLPDFLRSVAKKKLWGRTWVRQLHRAQRQLPHFDAGFTEAERWDHTDLQVAAMAWLQHQAQFARLVEREKPGRIATLDSVALLADPARTMDALNRLFDLRLSPAQVTQIAGGDAFGTDSKRRGEAHGSERRAAEQAAVAAAHGEEIEMVVRWAEAVANHVRVPMKLGRPLLG